VSAGETAEGEGAAGENEEEHVEPNRHRFGLTTSQVAASALAASCAALVASFLGVAGTISGAAIGSIVATTGSAFYGHAFHHGGKKIVKRLGPTTFLVSDAKPKAATMAQAGPPIKADETARTAPTGRAEAKRKSRYRKPIALAVAMLAVFGTAITVGMLAGGPIRQSGAGGNLAPSQTATRQQPATAPAGSSGPSATSTSPSGSASASSSGSSGTSSSSASPTPSPPSAGQTATALP
jgi:hypothetical protein